MRPFRHHVKYVVINVTYRMQKQRTGDLNRQFVLVAQCEVTDLCMHKPYVAHGQHVVSIVRACLFFIFIFIYCFYCGVAQICSVQIWQQIK